ncbi:class I SAM-dependent methyltransferase [Micromonospora sp. KLBMP9576]|uniref:class I SAM-dependent methyltransferase n=1 Tax=Micromonospora sp. KLBMP9576 TaxID=3424769 RepID=UPI003D91D14C
MAGPARNRPLGVVTRGTTNPNRLRRVDNWIVETCGATLREAADPLVVDLGYGASPVTAVELRARLAGAVRPDLQVVGLEIDPVRVAAAQPSADPPWLTFARGGFELAGLRPALVRAFNVLRQYDEREVADAWRTMTDRLAPGGLLVEGTCDELGRLGGWLLIDADGPRTLTLAARLTTLGTPAELAERLPKALIHRNVPGERVHDLIRALDDAWQAAAGYAPYGPRQRWLRAVSEVRGAGWPILDGPRRWRHGEVTVAWSRVAPVT